MEAKQAEAKKSGIVGKGIRPPVPLFIPPAEFTEKAKQAHVSGTCLVGLIVDPQGMPRNLKILKSLDPGLDQNALTAVNRYRLKPAMNEGEPVPVYVKVEVNFRLY